MSAMPSDGPLERMMAKLEYGPPSNWQDELDDLTEQVDDLGFELNRAEEHVRKCEATVDLFDEYLDRLADAHEERDDSLILTIVTELLAEFRG